MARAVRAAGVVALYLGLVVWLTWPLAAHLSDALPDVVMPSRYDPLQAGWAMASVSRALVTDPARLTEANIYHPTRHALFYGHGGFGALPLFAPAFLATGSPTTALNVTLIGALALTTAALHAVVTRWTGLPLAGLVAGWTVLTARWSLWEWMPTAPHEAALCAFPLVVLLAADATPTWPAIVALLVLVILQCLVDVMYVAPAVLGPLLLLALVRVARPATRRAGLRLAAVVGLAVLAVLPVLAGYHGISADNPNLHDQTLWRVPEAPVELPWGPFGTLMPMNVQPAILGLIALGALARLVAGRDGRTPGATWGHAGYWTLTGLALSLTPVVRWGATDVRTPLWLLQRLVPTLAYVRAPTRLGVGGLIGLSLLAGLGFAECARRLGPARSRRVVATALAAVVVTATFVEYSRGFSWPFLRRPLPAGYPLWRPSGPDDPLLPVLRAGSGPLVELPLAPRAPTDLSDVVDKLPFLHAAAMYRSIFHRRPILNGYGSFYPEAWPARLALADGLPDPTALAALRAETGLTTVVVHTADCTAEARERWQAASAGRDDLRLAARVGTDLVFDVLAVPAVAERPDAGPPR